MEHPVNSSVLIKKVEGDDLSYHFDQVYKQGTIFGLIFIDAS